jgi:tellurite resistance protein
VDIGCVFLFFYGLERRVLIDAEQTPEAEAEVPAILDEVTRLIGIYGDSNSFRSYATSFLDLARARYLPDTLAAAPVVEGPTFQMPLGVRVGIGHFVAERRPIPADWALAWIRHHPLARLRTAAVRCAAEFDTLFRIRYQEKFGEGMTVPPNKTRITVEYRPASRSFGKTFRIQLTELPDIAAVQAPLSRLETIAEEVTESLDKYSRWIGRTEDRDSPAALALLPPELAAERVRSADHALLRHLNTALGEETHAVVDTEQVLTHWPSKNGDRLSKKEAEALTDFIGLARYGVEPDIRWSNVNLSKSPKLAVFRMVDGASAPGDDYLNALLFLNLAVSVAGADELALAEEEQLERHLEAGYQLGEAERIRLRAHLAWLRACPPSPTAVKKQVEVLPEAQRKALGKALIVIAGADGHVSPRELKVLSKIYPILGLDPDTLYTDVHALAAGVRSSEPVTVLPPDAGDDFAIPRPEAKPLPARAVVLDAARVAAIREETRAVTAVLSSVFSDEEDVEADEPEFGIGEKVAEMEGEGADSVAGLDLAHSTLVRALVERPEWSRSEFDRIAEGLGLMPGGAIEIVNEAAFERLGEPLLEGSDPIEVNEYARERMLV